MPSGIYIKTEETRQKIGQAHKGKILSLETRKRISDSTKGRVSPRKGVTLTEETKKKISESKRSKPSYIRTEKHRELMRSIKSKQIIKKECLICKKELRVSFYRREIAKFCSRKCHNFWMSKNCKGMNSVNWKGGESVVVCLFCNNIFKTKPSIIQKREGKFCSRNCYGLWRSKNIRGDKHLNWQGGLTSLQEKIRKCLEYEECRKLCLERDNYTCQICGEIGGILNVDHIKPFAIILKENSIKSLEDAINCVVLWDINNLRTLCVDCHKQTESYLNNKIVKEYQYA